MAVVRVKFVSQVDATLLESVRELAKAECRPIQDIVEDVLRQDLEAKPYPEGSEHLMGAYLGSTKRFFGL